MATTPVNLDEKSVTISGEQYSITKIPGDKSKLVLDTKARILSETNLDDLLTNLSMVGRLLFVAYNGVAKQKELRGEISTLHAEYMRVCAKSVSVMGDFEKSCTRMLGYLTNLFDYLLDGEEDTALLYISYMAQTADKMATSATELKENFDNLFDLATKALSGAEVAKGTEEEKQAKLEEDRANFEALTAKAIVLRDAIKESKAKLQQLYEEAKEAAQKHEDRAFALAIVGAIMKPLGEGLGAFAGAMAGSKIPVSLPLAPPAAPKDDTPAKPKAEPSKEEVKAQQEAETKRTEAEKEVKETSAAAEKAKAVEATAKEAVEEAEEKLETAKEKLEEADDEEVKEEAKKEVEEAEEEVETATAEADKAEETAKAAQKKADDAQEKYRLLTAAMAGLGKGLSSAGDAVMGMSKSYSDIAADYNKEKQNYLNRLLDEQKLEREALADIEEYARRMQAIGKQAQVVELVVEALQQAIGALKRIVVILQNAADLWREMATRCKQLSDDSSMMRELIEMWKTKEKEARLKLYLGKQFVTQAVTYYADWKALEIISKDYKSAADKVKLQVQTAFQTNLTTDEMLKLAIKEGKELLSVTKAATKTLDAEQQAIEAELQKPTEALAAAVTA